MSDRRRRIETLFYNSGFSRRVMQPEIKRQIKWSDPERYRTQLKHHLLENSREQVIRLDKIVRSTDIRKSKIPLDDISEDYVKDIANGYKFVGERDHSQVIEGVAEANLVLDTDGLYETDLQETDLQEPAVDDKLGKH